MKSIKNNIFNSPAEGNAFTGAMAKTGGDYDKAKEMLDGMPMMGKPEEGISSRIKSRLGLGQQIIKKITPTA